MDRPDAAMIGPSKSVLQIGNALANYAGGIVALGSMLAFQALYAQMAGAEVFGLISLLFTVSLILPAFDLGMGRTAGLVIAERLPDRTAAAQLRTEVMALLIVNTATGLALGALLALAAKWIAVAWLRPVALGAEEIAMAVALVGANIPCLMVRQFTSACLNAMQRQALANMLLVAFIVVRGVAGALALWLPNPAIPFLLSQLTINALDALVCAGLTWRLLPAGRRLPRPNFAVIRRHRRFASGDAATSLLGVSMLHLDKVMLSALLPLSAYGSYALVATIATGIGRMVGPVAVAFLPHFVHLFVSGQLRRLNREYLLATQLSSCVVFPLAAVLMAFAPDIVAALLAANPLQRELTTVFALLIAASTLSNLMQLPHAIQLASGNSLVALRFTAVNALVYLMLVIPLTIRVGVLAPAIVLLSVYGISLFFFLRATQRIARIPVLQCFGQGTGRPVLAAVAVALAANWLLPGGIGPLWGSCALLISIAAASGMALALTPGARQALLAFAHHAAGREQTESARH